MTSAVSDPELLSALTRALRRWPQPDAPADHWRALAEEVELPAADPAQLRRHKVTGSYLRLRPGDGTESRRQRHRAAVLADELADVAGRLASAGVEHAVLRGPAIGRFYPPGWPREANDVDLVLRRPPDLATAFDALAPAGWFPARPVTTRRERGVGGTWAAAALNKLRPDLDHPVYLDLTVGGPAVDRCRCVVLPAAAWAGAGRVRIRDADVAGFGPVMPAQRVDRLGHDRRRQITRGRQPDTVRTETAQHPAVGTHGLRCGRLLDTNRLTCVKRVAYDRNRTASGPAKRSSRSPANSSMSTGTVSSDAADRTIPAP
jgi:Uncharacterised nucleotidyltransferase